MSANRNNVFTAELFVTLLSHHYCYLQKFIYKNRIELYFQIQQFSRCFLQPFNVDHIIYPSHVMKIYLLNIGCWQTTVVSPIRWPLNCTWIWKIFFYLNKNVDWKMFVSWNELISWVYQMEVNRIYSIKTFVRDERPYLVENYAT